MNNLQSVNVPSEAELLKQMQAKLRFRPFRLLVSYVAKLRYTLWLASLREVNILLTLTENYKRIPKHTPTYKFVSLFVRYPFAKKMLSKIGNRLRKRIY